MKITYFIIAAAFALPALGPVSAAELSPSSEAALSSALKNAKRSDERTKALKELAGYYLSINRLDRAVNAYRSTINDANISKKDKYLYYMTIGDMYLEACQYSSAMDYYQEAVGVLPRLEEARLKLARVYEQSDLNELAKQAYMDDLKFNKVSFDANFGLASVYLKQDLNTQAMEYFRRALTIKADPGVYRKAAMCAETSGDLALALAMLRQVPQEQRTYDDLVNLGRLYSETNRMDNAEESFSLAIKMNTEDVSGYVHLALLYLDSGRLDPAEKLLQIAAERSPGEGTPHFFLGYIYAAQKKTDLARAELKKAGMLSKTEILKTYSMKFQKYISK